MTYIAPIASMEPTPQTAALSRNERAILDELVEVLSAHPRGVRRWVVMRSIRASRTKRGRDIPHKFEDEVERTFRRHCSTGTEPHPAQPGGARFYRPKETAGEVWAIIPMAVTDPPAATPHPMSAEPGDGHM